LKTAVLHIIDAGPVFTGGAMNFVPLTTFFQKIYMISARLKYRAFIFLYNLLYYIKK